MELQFHMLYIFPGCIEPIYLNLFDYRCIPGGLRLEAIGRNRIH